MDSFEFPGLSGMEKMGDIMEALRKNPPKELAGYAVTTVTDFENSESTGLPRANILVFALENGESVIVRPVRHGAEN